MARIKLNSNFFHVPEGQFIESYAVDPQAEAFSTQGASRRIDNKKLRRFVQGWSDGIGIARKRREQNIGINGLRDADAETRFDHVSLPYLRVAGTGESGHFRKFFHFGGDLYVATEDNYASDAEGLAKIFKFTISGTDWNAAVTLAGQGSGGETEGVRHFDTVVFKGNVISVVSAGDPEHDGGNESAETELHLVRTTDFSTVVLAKDNITNTTILPTAITRRSNEDDFAARLCVFGNTLLIAANGGSGFITVYKSTDAHSATEGSQATIATVAQLTGASGTAGGEDHIRGFVVWRDPNTAGVPAAALISTEENIFILDVANNSSSELFPTGFLTGGPGDGRMVVGSNGNLYFVRGENIIEASIVGLGQTNIRNVGPASRTTLPNTAQAAEATLSGHGDGLVSSKQGVPTFLYGGSPDWL